MFVYSFQLSSGLFSRDHCQVILTCSLTDFPKRGEKLGLRKYPGYFELLWELTSIFSGTEWRNKDRYRESIWAVTPMGRAGFQVLIKSHTFWIFVRVRFSVFGVRHILQLFDRPQIQQFQSAKFDRYLLNYTFPSRDGIFASKLNKKTHEYTKNSSFLLNDEK